MKNRTLFIIIAVIGVIGFLFLAASASAVLGYTVIKALPKFSFKPDVSIAFAQNTQDHDQGILVASVASSSPAERAGIVRGDIILKANGQPVNLTPELLQEIQKLQPGDEVTLQVLHGDDLKEITLKLEEGESGLSLGISPCGPGLAEMFTHRFQSVNGALVAEVVKDGPAEGAGLKVGDVITAIDGKEIDADNRLPDLLSTYKPGDQVTLSVERSGAENLEISVTLGENPEDSTKPYLGIRYTEAPGVDNQQGGNQPFQMPFRGLPEDIPLGQPRFSLPEGVESGVVIGEVSQDSPAETAGLQSGDVVTTVDGETIDSADALVAAVQAKKPGDNVVLTIMRSGENAEKRIEVTLGENPDKAGAGYMGVKILEIKQQTNPQNPTTPQDLPSWLDKLLPKNFQLPTPPVNESPSEGGA